MKKLVWILLLVPLFNFAQSYHQKIANKTCDCIAKDTKTKDLNELLQNCVIASKIEVDNNEAKKQDKGKNTVEGIRTTFAVVSKLVIKNCSSFKPKRIK